jgi:hypothetical protein
LRPRGWDKEVEIKSMQKAASQLKGNSDIKSLFHSSFYRPLFLGLFVNTFQQWSGIDAVMFNTASLFVTAGQDPGSQNSLREALKGAILVNAVQVLVTIYASTAVEKFGRKKLLSLSYLGMGACNMFVAIYGHSSASLKIGLFVFYIALFAIGSGPVTSLFCSEIFPSRTQTLGMTICSVTNRIHSFLVISTFSYLISLFGQNGVFAIYGLICLVASAYFLTVVETKDKTFEEIEQAFQGQ